MPRILVIDDEDDYRDTLCELLERSGYEVIAARNGRAGLKALREYGADVVITDIVMPDMEGIEVIMALRASHPDVPIIAMSGSLDKLFYLQIVHYLGAVEALPKPIAYDDLIAAVRRALGDRR